MRYATYFLTFVLWANAAAAADPSERKDPIRGQWFKSLIVPGGVASCCDVSDCSKVEAFQQGNAWFAKIGDEVIPVPPGVVLDHPLSIDGDAYACIYPKGVLRCFIPPIPGF